MKRVARAVVACLAIAVAMLAALPAWAKFQVPPLVGHVVDTAGVLSAEDVQALNDRMEAIRLQSGYTIDALVTGSLEGEDVADVAYETFNTWKIGEKKADNGVLIVIAPNDRKDFLATGRGVEGALTDLQTDDIRRKFIEPRLKANDFRGAIAAGTDAIAQTLLADSPGHPGARAPSAAGTDSSRVIFYVLVLVVVILIFSRGGGRGGGFWWFGGGGWGGGGGGGGWGGGGGGGFGGGGGSSGGGGSGGSY